MKLKNFQPTFRNVLLEEIKIERTKGGIVVPLESFTIKSEDSRVAKEDFKDQNKYYKVVKVGRLCEEVKPGDTVTLTSGIRLVERTVENKQYSLVYEQQIDGYERS